MLTLGADTGVLRVELNAWVRAFDLPQFVMHAVMVVGVHVAQPCRGFVPVHTFLGER